MVPLSAASGDYQDQVTMKAADVDATGYAAWQLVQSGDHVHYGLENPLLIDITVSATEVFDATQDTVVNYSFLNNTTHMVFCQQYIYKTGGSYIRIGVYDKVNKVTESYYYLPSSDVDRITRVQALIYYQNDEAVCSVAVTANGVTYRKTIVQPGSDFRSTVSVTNGKLRGSATVTDVVNYQYDLGREDKAHDLKAAFGEATGVTPSFDWFDPENAYDDMRFIINDLQQQWFESGRGQGYSAGLTEGRVSVEASVKELLVAAGYVWRSSDTFLSNIKEQIDFFFDRGYREGLDSNLNYTAGYQKAVDEVKAFLEQDGVLMPEATLQACYEKAKDVGWTECADQGTLTQRLIYTVLEAPVNVALGSLNFELFGFNLAQILFGILSVILVFFIIKTVLDVVGIVL